MITRSGNVFIRCEEIYERPSLERRGRGNAWKATVLGSAFDLPFLAAPSAQSSVHKFGDAESVCVRSEADVNTWYRYVYGHIVI